MLDKLFKKTQKFLKPLSNNKFLLGLSLIIINIGSKYIEMNLTDSQEELIRKYVGREILIFSIVFLGTKDVIISILMTAAFIILSSFILHEESSFCILPTKLKKVSDLIDLNNDNHVSNVEFNTAMKTLQKLKNKSK
tara:strand:- start:771 stop:1181 length:411 start_codon:yes stop_codon:yes gene_type:complete